MRVGIHAGLLPVAVLAAGVGLPGISAAEVTQAQLALYERLLEFPSLVRGGEVTPIWLPDGNRFVYASASAGKPGFIEVDPATGSSRPFFDDARLRSALALAGQAAPEGLPFQTFTVVDGGRAARFQIQGRWFDLTLASYALRELTPEEMTRLKRLEARVTMNHFPDSGGIARELPSPRKDLFLRVQDNNLWVRSSVDDRSRQLTDDGADRFSWCDGAWPYAASAWSADGNTLAAFKADARQVHYMPVVHWLKRGEEVSYHMYAPAGGTLPYQQLYFIDVPSGAKKAVEMGADAAYFRSAGWHPNGQEFLFFWLSRSGKRVELRAAHKDTGAVRVLWADENDKTFAASTMRFMRDPEPAFRMLSDGRFIVGSERSGWRHLYLYGPGKGGKIELLRQLTQGEFPIIDVVHVDESKGWVYFTAHNDQKRAYDIHLLRVGLNGGASKQLTDETGEHKYLFSPSGEYFLDTHSTVTRPPATSLRRADGTLVTVVEKADIGALTALGWQPPEEFVVKAADGVTDLYGIVRKPANFDPAKKYPVVEYLYGGPQSTAVQRTFKPAPGLVTLSGALTQLGFVSFTVDARGTPERSKAFQDVVYGNWGRNEIADHAAALRAVAKSRPYMDLTRVGIFGHSYGGYYTTRAMLQAPDLYKVGVASAPASHLSSIFALASENYMGGTPQEVPEAYEYASNLRLADRLQGKFLLIHPTSDVNAPFAHMVQLTEAFIRAGKKYDLNIFPEGNHGYTYADMPYAHPFWRTTIRDYFVEHLQP